MVPDQFPFWKLPCTSNIELTNVRMTSILIERLFTQLLGGGAGMTEYWISGTYVVVDCRISYTPQSSINKHARITSPDFSFRPSFYGMAFGADTLCFIPSKIREHKEIAMHLCIFRILPRVYFSKLRWFINYDQMVLLWNVMLRNWIQCLCLHFPTDQDVHRVVNWLWEDLGKRIRVAYRKRSEGTLFPGSELYIIHFMRISH